MALVKTYIMLRTCLSYSSASSFFKYARLQLTSASDFASSASVSDSSGRPISDGSPERYYGALPAKFDQRRSLISTPNSVQQNSFQSDTVLSLSVMPSSQPSTPISSELSTDDAHYCKTATK